MVEQRRLWNAVRNAGAAVIAPLRYLLPVLAALLLWQGEARATHAMGGELTYECIGPNLYRVRLNFYRDCNGVAAPTNCNNGRQFRLRSTQCNATLNPCFGLDGVDVVTPLCFGAADRCTSTSGVYGIERYRYSAVVNLSAFAGCGTDWIIDWTLCCRNNAITSLNNPGSRDLYLYARLNNTLPACNNSPRYLNDPTPFACVGQPVSYNHGFNDIDGDSLSFELAPALSTNGALIPYNTGYTFQQPVVTGGGANAVQINPVTGTITFTPSIQQFAVVTVRVREWRNGVQIGEYIRDVQFAIIACSNNLPTVSGVNGTGQYTFEVCAGQSFCFTVNSADANAAQLVTMAWNNGIPSGTFTVSGGPRPVGTFCWTPTVADIGQNLFSVNVQDNACPLVGLNNFGFAIQVTPPFTPANAGPDQSVCGTTATLAGVLPFPQVQGTWTVVNGGGTFANPNNPTTTVSGLGAGTNTFRWTVNYQTCGTTSDDVVITAFNPAQAAANAGPLQELCLPSTSTTLAANTAVAPAVGSWTVVSGTGTFANASAPNTTVSGLSAGNNVLRWTINNGPCGAPTSSTVTIRVFTNTQAPANAGVDQQLCAPVTSATLSANAANVPATGTWSVVTGSGTFVNANSPSTTVSGLSPGVNTLRWTINNGPCIPSTTTDDVVITVFDPNSPPANAGPAQQVCSPGTTLAGSTPIAPATGAWTVISGTGTFANANSPTTSVTGLSIGNNVFQWTVNNSPCANGITTSQVVITRFSSTLDAAAAGPDQELCTTSTGAASTIMAGSAVALPATGTWTIQSGPAGAVIANPASPTTGVSNLGVGTYVLRWTVNNGPCVPPTSFDEVTIRVFDRNAPAAQAGSNVNLCSPVTSVTLAANAAVSPAVGTWSVVSGSGTFSNINSPTATVTGVGLGANVYQWSISNGPCPGAITTSTVTVTIFDAASASANAGPDQLLCGASSATLAGSTVTAPAQGTWTVLSGTANIANPNNPTTSVNGLGTGATVLRWTVNNGPCGSSSDEVTLFNFDPSNAIANAGPDQNICVPVAPNAVFMSASAVTFPATGTWTIVSGSGTIVSPNSPTTQISNLSVGIHEFQWTVSNGPCAGGVTSDVVRIQVYDFSNPIANAGPDQSICSTSGSTTLAGSSITVPATGSWTLVSGTGVITDPASPNTTVTGLGIGQNIFQWTVDNGPCTGITTDQMSIFIYDPNNPAANAGPSQSFCTPVTNTTMQGSAVTFPAQGTWTQASGPVATIASPNDPNTAITGIGVGVSTFVWTVNNGACPNPITSSSMTITLADGNAQAADAGPDQSLCGTSTGTSLAGNVPVGVAIGSWSVVSGTATFANTASPTTAVSGLSIGLNELRWSIDNGACGITSDQLTILVYDPNNPVANAGNDVQLCTPASSVTLNGSALILPAVGQWTLVSGSGSIANPAGPTTVVNGLAVGENVFQWQVNNGACPNAITADLISVFVYDNTAAAANAGPDQDVCTPTTSVSMAGNTPTFPGIGLWTLIAGGGSIAQPNNPNTSINNLPVGVNIFAWTIVNGPCGSTSDQVVIRVFDALNPVANAGVDQQLCTPNTSTTLQGSSLTIPATGTWSLVSGTGTITDPTNPATTVTGLAIGENVFRWSVSNGPCANSQTTDLVSIFVFDESQEPAAAGPDQELCTPDSEATLSANTPTFPAEGMWFQVSGFGTITDPSDPNTTVTGLPVGTHEFQWMIANGPCAGSETTDNMVIRVYDANNLDADAGADQELCTPQTSTTLQGSAVISPAIGTWTVVSGTGVFANANDPNTVVSGLSVGSNIFKWTVDNGPCGAETTDEVTILLFDADNAVANAGQDLQQCTPNTVATLFGSAVTFPSTGLWTLVSGTGVITDPTSATTTVTDLGVGENIFQWTVSNGPCANGVTSDQISIFIFDLNNPPADAGADQQLCTPQVSTTMQGVAPTFPAFGTWTLLSGQGIIVDPNDPNSAITDLGVGENTFLWTIDNGPCENSGSIDVVSIFVFDGNNADADAGADQELCTPNIVTTNLQGSAVTFPAVGTWTLVSGTGTIANPNDPNTVVFDISIGESVFEWTVDNGPCANGVTTDQVSIRVYDANLPVANAGADQQQCTPNITAQLSGSPVVFPAVGTWSIQSGTGNITDPNDPNTTITGLGVGVIVVRWTVSNGACPDGVTTDEMVITLFDENNPLADAGPDQELCSNNASTTMAASAVIFPATGTWTLVNGSGTIANPNDPTTAVSGLGIGENIFQWVVNNGVCANPQTTDVVSIFVFDENNPDADAGPDQEVCTPLTSATMAGSSITFPAVGTWTLISGQGTITDPSDPATTITDLGVGTNVFEWTVDNGDACANSLTSDQVTIVLFDADAPPANAGADQELCSPDDSATLIGNPPVGAAIGVWTLAQGTGVIADPFSPTTTVSGLTIGENIFRWTLTGGVCVTTDDEVSIFVFDPNNPVANAGLDQELCMPQDSVFMAGSSVIFPAQGTWTLISGAGTPVDANDPATLIEGLAIGVNVFQWEVDNGACETTPTFDLVTITLYGDTTSPAIAGPDLESCLPVTQVQLQGEQPIAPGIGTWSVIAGTGVFADPNNPTAIVTGLSQGVNTFVWTLDWFPCPNNGLLTDTVTVRVYNPNAPLADAGPDQQLCTPTTETFMEGNSPEIPGVGTWTLLSGSGTIVSPNDANTQVTDLAIGINEFIWTIYNGNCGFGPPSQDTVRVFVYDGEATPATAGNDISWCTPTNNAVLVANDPTFPATGLWTSLSGTGTLVDPTDPNTAVFDLGVGQHDFQWTIDNGACGTSSDVISVFIFDGESEAADAGPDQELCTPTTSATLAGNAVVFPASGFWTVITGTGTFADASDPSTTVSGLSIGTNVLRWTITNGPCGDTEDDVVITVFDANQPGANAGADQQICTPASSVILQGSAVTFPAVGTWVFVSGTGTLSDPNSPTATLSGLGVGSVTLQWQVDNGPCGPVTTDQVNINVFDNGGATALAGPDQDFCSPVTGTVTMFASSPVAPGVGLWTLLSGTGTIAEPSNPFTVITGLGIGENRFQWTIDNGPCGSTNDVVSLTVYDSTVPAANAGPDQEFCQDIGSTQLNAEAVFSTASGVWTVLNPPGGNASIAQPGNADSDVDGFQLIQLPETHYAFIWSVNNGPFPAGSPCGPTADTMMVHIKDCVTVKVPDAFSPNGDGVNDLLVITNIETYPNNRITIFNRWGNKVYEASPYTNQWDGTSQFGTMYGETLPESTYYYVLDLGDGSDAYTGFIYLRR